ncbi:MAG: hypothetical protein HUJ42_02850 [Malacoplasma sp.]|nr:hypothetical protein [Malacoplasma sp.]
MKFKNLLVSEDNQLVLSDYGLNENDAEVLDLNKSLSDVANDNELITFIKENAINPEKIYIFCVKEDFGNNDQLLTDIPDIKKIGKSIKKTFKKLPNIYFFVYNTHLKNNDEINPSLDTLVAEQDGVVIDDSDAIVYDDTGIELGEEYVVEENQVIEETIPAEEVAAQNDVIVANEDLPLQEETTVIEETKVENEFNPFETVPIQEVKEEEEIIVANEDLPLQDEASIFEEVTATPVEEAAVIEDDVIVANEDLPLKEEAAVIEEVVETTTVEDNVFEEVPIASEFENVVANSDALKENDADQVVDQSVDVLEFEDATQEVETVEELNDVDQLNAIVDNNIDEFASYDDSAIKQDIIDNYEIKAEVSNEAPVLFDEPQMLSDADIPIESVISDDVVNYGVDNNEAAVVVDSNSGIEMPSTFFDSEKDDEITYEDYSEFTNDYELNIHALKSIYDFIWRILVLNNYELKLNDLLYIAVNNLDAFAVGQSDFVRQTANKANSLFDLILQLDVKLEFNNSLFYIYLAQFFNVSGNSIHVNEKFLDTISIWVNQNSKQKFIQQVEQFMNYSSIYNKKIIFSYFIELANFIKGKLPTVAANLSLLDIHRLINNKFSKMREENIFAFMVKKMNQIFADNGTVIEMYLVKTPDNMFGIEVNQPSDAVDKSWKTQLALLYKQLLENIVNYILLKGNKETEIFNLYIDIRDLRMYQDFIANNTNVLSPETMSALNNKTSTFLTIGDEMNRLQSIVPSQRFGIQNECNCNHHLNNLSHGANMENRFKLDKDVIINSTTDNINYPKEVELTQDAIIATTKEKYTAKFNISEFENSISKRIEEYEKKIKNNISRIEAERKMLREKMEELKNI